MTRETAEGTDTEVRPTAKAARFLSRLFSQRDEPSGGFSPGPTEPTESSLPTPTSATQILSSPSVVVVLNPSDATQLRILLENVRSTIEADPNDAVPFALFTLIDQIKSQT